jgi:membrane fusion protein, heavy metal efflux system
MSTVTAPNKKKVPLVAGVVVAGLALTVGIFALSRGSRRPGQTGGGEPAAPPVQAQLTPAGAGKVGDLVVTQEAMELAEIRTAPAGRRSVAEKLAVSGTVETGGDRLAKVTARVPGKIVRVSAMAGDQVRAGQTLALLESTELAQSQSAYQQAAQRVALAQNNLQRQRKLAGLGVFGKPRVEEARKEVVAAQGEVNATENEIAAAKNEVNEARSEKASLEGEVAAAESAVASAQSEATSGNSEVAEAEGQVKALQAALSQAQSRVKVAESRFNRLDTLLKEEIVSRQEWEQAQSDVQEARADVDAARANIQQGQAKVETAKAHREAAQAQVEAARAKVRAERGRLQQAAAKIETALARQAQVETRLVTAKKRAQIAAQALAREEAVYKGGFGTTKEIVEAEAAVRQAQLERDAAERQVRLLGGSPGGGSTITLTSPIAGRIHERNASPGETVATEHPLFTVMNLDLVWAQLAVSPNDLHLVRSGQRVVLTADAAPGRTFTGTVSAIGNTADEATRAVRVRVALVNRDGALRPETFMRGNIITDVRRERVTVPLDALQDHSGKPTVYVALDGTPGVFEVRHVKLGVTGEGWREIAEGLQAGERIAVHGTFYLKSEALKSSLSDGCCATNTGE